MNCHSLLQGIFHTQGSNRHLLNYRQVLYHLRRKESYRQIKLANMLLEGNPLLCRGLSVIIIILT